MECYLQGKIMNASVLNLFHGKWSGIHHLLSTHTKNLKFSEEKPVFHRAHGYMGILGMGVQFNPSYY